MNKCPACAATLAPQAQWCSLCHLTLVQTQTQTQPPAELEPTIPVAPERFEAIGQAVPDAGLEVPAPGQGEAAQTITIDVSMLASENALPAGLGGLANKVQSNGGKAAVMAGGMVLVSVALFAVMCIVGVFLR
ncbi:MAG: hypothetical protein F2792_03480 [Actinobacteria bacterium]|nr:hypothetical protein [Actinomycetota bacterium]